MYDELTEVDIKKMQEEIDYRMTQLRPKLIEDVKTAREWGDLSENFEYKAAKREKNRNDSRIRYLERMIKTAKVVPFVPSEGIGLFDTVVLWMENLRKEQTVRLATALRQDAMHGIISKDSPVGKAIFGKKAGDRVEVEVAPGRSYWVEIRSVTKAQGDDESLDIRGYCYIPHKIYDFAGAPFDLIDSGRPTNGLPASGAALAARRRSAVGGCDAGVSSRFCGYADVSS